jgi:RND family efflux transporter MFP subunit
MSHLQSRHTQWAGALIALALALLPGCQKAPPKMVPPPPQVTVTQPVEREVVRWEEYSGYLSSPKTVTVNARVSGLIVAAPFQEGALVHQGDLLFKIDPRPFQADFDNKQAAVAQAKATADKAQADFHRYALLLKAQVIARADYDTYKANYEEAQASLEAAKAALETSRLNLQWTDVRAPISGRVGRINVTVGNLIMGGSTEAVSPTTLTSIVSIDPLYSYINVPESTALLYQKIALQEHQSNVAAAKEPCYLRLENETNFPHQGLIDFVNNQVDVSTGTVQMRCVVANPTGLLTAGLFAVTRVPASGRYQALLIPDQAVNTDQNERYLLIVGDNDIVRRQTVTLGALFGNLRAITVGLKSHQDVIVEGMQWAMPGAKVDPHEAPISPNAAEVAGQGPSEPAQKATASHSNSLASMTAHS